MNDEDYDPWDLTWETAILIVLLLCGPALFAVMWFLGAFWVG